MKSDSPILGTSRELARQLESQIRSGQWAVGSKLPSIRQIAQQHEMSVGTVQRALSQLEAMKLITYRPRRRGVVRDFQKPRAARHRTAATYLGVIFPCAPDQPVLEKELQDDHETWSRHILQSIQNTASAAEYDMLVLSQSVTAKRDQSVLNRIDNSGGAIGGLIIFQLQQIPDLAAQLTKRNIPWVTIDRPNNETTHNFVSSNFNRAGLMVGRTFAQIGFKNVLMLLSHFQDFRSSAELSAGFVQAYLEAGKSPSGIEYVFCDNSQEAHGYEMTQRFLAKGNKPQAIFASGDRQALGAIRACKDAGLRVPEDVSVVGSTGLELARYASPSLAVVAQPMQRIGQTAAEMVLQMIQSGNRQIPGILFDPVFIARKSLALPASLSSGWIIEA